MFVTDAVDCGETSRRPLLDAAERQLMSEAIVLSTADESVPTLLSQIELEIEGQTDAAGPAELHLQHGPFGVFTIHKNRYPAPTPGSFGEEALVCPEPSVDLGLFDLPVFNEALLDFDLGIGEFGITNDPDTQFRQSTDTSTSCCCNSSKRSPAKVATREDMSVSDPFLQAVAFASPPRSSPSTFSIKGLVIDEVTFLMSKYKDTVIPLLSPVKRIKTMWHVIFLTGGMNTLAALTLNTNPGPASLVELFSLLSITAMSLRGTQQNSEWERWNAKGLEYLTKAEQLLQTTLARAFLPTKEAKYKTILAAILGVSQASVSAKGDPFFPSR